MNYDFVRYLGESLGSHVNAKLIYLFLAYQVTMSALVFLFDSGFPPWLVIGGWALFLVLLAAQILRRRKTEKQEEKEYRRQEQLSRQLITRLKERLKTDPDLQTLCQDCSNFENEGDPCRAHAGPALREFHFRRDDSRSYCLFWSPGKLHARP